MKIMNAKVDWMYDYGNDPHLKVLVDQIPKWESLRWEEVKPGLFYAEKEGYSDKFSYTRPGEGYGGRSFTITMEDGSEKTLKGPWSSRAGCCTMAGYPSIDISITSDPKVFHGKGMWYAGMITLEKAKEAIAMIRGVGLIALDSHKNGEVTYVPYLFNNQCVGHMRSHPTGGNARCVWCGHKIYKEEQIRERIFPERMAPPPAYDDVPEPEPTIQDRLSLDLFGTTIEQALSQNICIECKKTPKFYSQAGKKEYPISGLCEFCFDLTMLSREEAEAEWRRVGVSEHLWPEKKEVLGR